MAKKKVHIRILDDSPNKKNQVPMAWPIKYLIIIIEKCNIANDLPLFQFNIRNCN